MGKKQAQKNVLPEGKITVEKDGRYWSVVEHFDNGGRAWSSFPDQASAQKAAGVLRSKGLGYSTGGAKEAGLIHDKAWDAVEPRLARTHARHARAFMAGIPKSQLNKVAGAIERMKKIIIHVEHEAAKGPKNADQTRRAQAELFDVQFEIEKILKP